MSESDYSTTEPNQKPSRKLWPWVITSIVALLIALFLRVWVPQEYDTSLLAQIDAAGGTYSIDTTGRPEAGSYLPEAGSILDDMTYVELFDRVEDLTLPKVDSELFADSVAAFKSLESLEFDLGNSADFDRETAARMTDLEYLKVTAYEEVERADYAFLAGCQSVTHLVLPGAFHDDGFWQFLPEMKSLERVELQAGSQLHGEGIPNLAQSNFSEMIITGVTEDCELRSLANLFTAGKLNELTVERLTFNLSGNVPQIGPTSLTSLTLNLTGSTDQLFPILAQVKSLEKLVFQYFELTGETMDLLAVVPIQEMEFNMVPASAEAIENLSRFGSLKRLYFHRVTGVKPEWLLCWADSPLSASLETLEWHLPGAGDELIDALQTFSSLKSLTLWTLSTQNYSTAAILKLADHPTLEQLNIYGRFPRELIFDFRKRVNDRDAKFPQIEYGMGSATRGSGFTPYPTLPTSPGIKSVPLPAAPSRK